jgi:plasmid replication initiation protein
MATTQPRNKKKEPPRPAAPLASQLDLFFTDITEPNLRDEQHTMSLPFFSLSKGKRVKPILYQRGAVKIEVTANATYGMANIWDADFLIWIASQVNEKINAGETPTRRLWILPYDFFYGTKRIKNRRHKHPSGKDYENFGRMLDRLKTTNIKTTLPAGGETIKEDFSWISEVKQHIDAKGRIYGVELELSSWFFNRLVQDRAVLSIDPDYFLLTGGIERWLYRVARKHAGDNDVWSFPLKTLYDKYPPGRDYRRFKNDLKKVVEKDCIPEYHTSWQIRGEGRSTEEWIVFTMRRDTRMNRRLPRALRTKSTQPPQAQIANPT